MDVIMDRLPVLDGLWRHHGSTASTALALSAALYFGGGLWLRNWGRYIVGQVAPTSALSQQFPPDPTFVPQRDVPDLAGKVAIVTGGNSGLGYLTAKALLVKNATVYIAARSPARCQDAVRRLRDETGGREPVVLQLDLADLRSVRKAAEEFLAKEGRLDFLFNNAGVMTPPNELLTAQGYDFQFGVHVLGHYFFTKLLLPALRRSTEHRGAKARVIHTSSSSHTLTSPSPTGIDFAALKGGPVRDAKLKEWGAFGAPWKLYGASKMGCVMASNLLVRHHGDALVSFAVNPGGTLTELHRYAPPVQMWVSELIFYPPPYGALTQLWGATVLPASKVNGQYLIPWARFGHADPRAADEKVQDELLTWLEEQLKGF